MIVLGGNGPFVLSRYKKLVEEQELDPSNLHAQTLMQARREIRHNPLKQSANDVSILVVAPLVSLAMPIATTVESIFCSFVSKKREKKAAVEFFEQE